MAAHFVGTNRLPDFGPQRRSLDCQHSRQGDREGSGKMRYLSKLPEGLYVGSLVVDACPGCMSAEHMRCCP